MDVFFSYKTNVGFSLKEREGGIRMFMARLSSVDVVRLRESGLAPEASFMRDDTSQFHLQRWQQWQQLLPPCFILPPIRCDFNSTFLPCTDSNSSPISFFSQCRARSLIIFFDRVSQEQSKMIVRLIFPTQDSSLFKNYHEKTMLQYTYFSA